MSTNRNPIRRLTAILMLIAALAGTSAVIAHANPNAAGGRSSDPGIGVNGFWGGATCAFSLVLAKADPSFYGSALLICARVFLLDP